MKRLLASLMCLGLCTMAVFGETEFSFTDRWSALYKTDEFGDQTDEVFLQIFTQGTFDDASNIHAPLFVFLDANITYDNGIPRLYFEFEMYKKTFNTYSSMCRRDFTMKTKDEKGNVESYYVAYPFDGTFPYRLYLNDNILQFYNSLKTCENLKVVITSDNDRFRFSLNCKGFYDKLKDNVEYKAEKETIVTGTGWDKEKTYTYELLSDDGKGRLSVYITNDTFMIGKDGIERIDDCIYRVFKGAQKPNDYITVDIYDMKGKKLAGHKADPKYEILKDNIFLSGKLYGEFVLLLKKYELLKLKVDSGDGKVSEFIVPTVQIRKGMDYVAK